MLKILPSNYSINRYGLNVRFVNESDAEFIVNLRTDEQLGRFINSTSPNIQDQIKWTRLYKEREKNGLDYYFIFEDSSNGEKLGVDRIYDITSVSFTTGSWLFKRDSPLGAAIIADIITREIAYELFPTHKHLFDIKKSNVTVNRYAQSFHSEIIYESEDTNYYANTRENFEKYKKLHLRMFKK